MTDPRPCSKTRYFTRKEARRARRNSHLDHRHLRPYICGDCGLFHLGAIPLAALAGEISAADLYDDEPTR